jgi:hypothetical protein
MIVLSSGLSQIYGTCVRLGIGKMLKARKCYSRSYSHPDNDPPPCGFHPFSESANRTFPKTPVFHVGRPQTRTVARTEIVVTDYIRSHRLTLRRHRIDLLERAAEGGPSRPCRHFRGESGLVRRCRLPCVPLLHSGESRRHYAQGWMTMETQTCGTKSPRAARSGWPSAPFLITSQAYESAQEQTSGTHARRVAVVFAHDRLHERRYARQLGGHFRYIRRLR